MRFNLCGVLAGQNNLMGWYAAWRVDCEMMAHSAYWDWWKTFDTALYETLLSAERSMRHELMDGPLTVCGMGGWSQPELWTTAQWLCGDKSIFQRYASGTGAT